MSESKSEQHLRQSEEAKRTILRDWPSYQRRAARDARARGRGGRPITPDEQLRDAVELVLEVARLYKPRGKGPHTPLGHDCEVCDAMGIVVEWLVTGKAPPVDMT